MTTTPPTVSSMTSELADLIEKIKQLRGPPEVWLRKEVAIGKWLASDENVLKNFFRVLCKGEWRGETEHLPAVLIYSEQTKRILVWCPQGASDVMVVRDIHHFHSTTPHAAVAREVYGDDSKGSTL